MSKPYYDMTNDELIASWNESQKTSDSLERQAEETQDARILQSIEEADENEMGWRYVIGKELNERGFQLQLRTHQWEKKS